MFSRLFVLLDALAHAVPVFARSTSYLNNALLVWTRGFEESDDEALSSLQSNRQAAVNKRSSGQPTDSTFNLVWPNLLRSI